MTRHTEGLQKLTKAQREVNRVGAALNNSRCHEMVSNIAAVLIGATLGGIPYGYGTWETQLDACSAEFNLNRTALSNYIYAALATSGLSFFALDATRQAANEVSKDISIHKHYTALRKKRHDAEALTTARNEILKNCVEEAEQLSLKDRAWWYLLAFIPTGFAVFVSLLVNKQDETTKTETASLLVAAVITNAWKTYKTPQLVTTFQEVFSLDKTIGDLRILINEALEKSDDETQRALNDILTNIIKKENLSYREDPEYVGLKRIIAQNLKLNYQQDAIQSPTEPENPDYLDAQQLALANEKLENITDTVYALRVIANRLNITEKQWLEATQPKPVPVVVGQALVSVASAASLTVGAATYIQAWEKANDALGYFGAACTLTSFLLNASINAQSGVEIGKSFGDWVYNTFRHPVESFQNFRKNPMKYIKQGAYFLAVDVPALATAAAFSWVTYRVFHFLVKENKGADWEAQLSGLANAGNAFVGSYELMKLFIKKIIIEPLMACVSLCNPTRLKVADPKVQHILGEAQAIREAFGQHTMRDVMQATTAEVLAELGHDRRTATVKNVLSNTLLSEEDFDEQTPLVQSRTTSTGSYSTNGTDRHSVNNGTDDPRSSAGVLPYVTSGR